MGTLTCPLCCGDEFTDQLSLRYHLLSMIDNVYCPQCSQRFDTILQLAKHLDGMCGSTDGSKERKLKLESYCDNKMNMVHCTPEIGTNKNNINVLEGQYEICKEEQDIDIHETQLTKVTELGMDSSATDVLCFRNECLQTIEHSEDSSCLNDLRDVEEQSEDMEDEPMSIYGSLNMKCIDIKKPPEYSCSVCDVTFTSISEHINVFHRGQEVAVKVMDKDKGVLERLVDVEVSHTFSSGEGRRGDEELTYIDERIAKDNSTVNMNVNKKKLPDIQIYPSSKENITVALHDEKTEQTSSYFALKDKFNKRLRSRLSNEGRKCGKDVSLIVSGGLKKELKIQRVIKNEKKNVGKLFSESYVINKDKNTPTEFCETIVKSSDVDKKVHSNKILINNTISVFTCTLCKNEFGNVSMFKKHSCPWSKIGAKSMKTVHLKPETSLNTNYSSQETQEKNNLELVLQVVRCKFCSLTFKKLGHFRKHMKMHCKV